jgi:hypothetical protein
MHTDDTLRIFEDVTVHIGSEFRTFNKRTCPAFDTRELRREVNARKSRQLKRSEAKASEQPKHGTSKTVSNPVSDADRPMEGSKPTNDKAPGASELEPSEPVSGTIFEVDGPVRGPDDKASETPRPESSNHVSVAVSETDRPLRKVLNIQTYKHHALGDYPKTIRQFGTTDSFSTEPVRHTQSSIVFC